MRVIVLITILALSTSVVGKEKFPVMVGGNDDLDACMTLGAIKINNGNSSYKISVYAGPSGESKVIDKLPNGTRIMICDSASDGWIGIVYSGDDSPYCGLTSPINPKQPYKGSCKSGWIKETNVEILAG